MFEDGKYRLRKDDQEYEVVIITLSIHEGLYSKTSELKFVCIPGHFPIPLDSWLLEETVILPVDQPSANRWLTYDKHQPL